MMPSTTTGVFSICETFGIGKIQRGARRATLSLSISESLV